MHSIERTNFSSGAQWEDIIGYSRAVRVGNMLEISGTVATDSKGDLVGKDDPYLQTRCIIEKISTVLAQAGASLADVTRTRLFVTDISRWEEYGRAHGEYFRAVKPCTSMVEVRALINPDYLVEIEVTAMISGGPRNM